MNRENSKKYSRVAKLIGILSGFVFVLGTSYAVFRVTTTGKKENVVSAGKLDVRIENEQNEISLGNALPQTEEKFRQETISQAKEERQKIIDEEEAKKMEQT